MSNIEECRRLAGELEELLNITSTNEHEALDTWCVANRLSLAVALNAAADAQERLEAECAALNNLLKYASELYTSSDIGSLVRWRTVGSDEFVGVIREWDNGTAIVLCSDGQERSVRAA